MAFMTGEVTKGYAEVERTNGETFYVPSAYAGDVTEEGDTVTYHDGYIGRLSASGYLDATDWTPLDADTADAALRELADAGDVCPQCWEQCWDMDETCEGAEIADGGAR